MTYNFVNLISWEFFNRENTQNSCIHLDSFTIAVLARVFGYKRLRKESGVEFFRKMDLNDDTIVLSPDKRYNLFPNIYTIPFPIDFEDYIELDLISKKIRNFHRIIIGISSPRQDELALTLQKLFPEKEFY